MPDSSKKTSQADAARAPFDPWPFMRDPVLDGLLVAFLGLACRALHAPAQPLSQQPPHRWVRQPHPGQPLDHHRDPVQRPHVGGEPIGQRPLQQCLLDRLQGAVRNLGVAAGRPTRPQRRRPVGLPAGVPAAALWRETSSSRATSACVRPWANSSAARSRRAWRSARCWVPRVRACWVRRLVDMAGHAPTPAVPVLRVAEVFLSGYLPVQVPGPHRQQSSKVPEDNGSSQMESMFD
jgi:hypothetical protein